MNVIRFSVASLVIAANVSGAHADVRRPATAGGTAIAVVHRYFGTIVSVKDAAFVLALRNGTRLRVDASPAFRATSVSEPLFPGKATVVDGTLGADGIVRATSVRRAATLPANWGADL